MSTPLDIDAVETKRMLAQVDLDLQKSRPERNKLGQFATPLPLAIDIAQAAKAVLGDNQCPIHFGETACGTGVFFSAIFHVFGQERIASATGIEIDAEFAQIARDLWHNLGVTILEGDFTNAEIRNRANHRPSLSLNNPSYARHQHLTREVKQHLRELSANATGITVNGRASMYVYFILLAHAWLEDGALSSWLVPSSFMDVNYGVALRDYLTQQVSLISIHRFDPKEAQFDDALVSSAVVTFIKTPPSPNATAMLSFGGSVVKPSLIQEVSLKELGHTRKWTQYPGHIEDHHALCCSDANVTLDDLFHIQRGVATGANSFFMLDRNDPRLNDIPKEFLRPILPSPRYLTGAVVEAEEDGFPSIDKQLILIDCDIPEEQLEEKCPELWTYLSTASGLGLLDRHLISKRKLWYKQEHRAPARFVCAYMRRENEISPPFRFLLNRSQAIVTNVYLMLYPKKQLADILAKDPDIDICILDLLRQITAKSLRQEGRVYGGGLHKIEPNELGRVSAASLVARFPMLKPQSGSVDNTNCEGINAK